MLVLIIQQTSLHDVALPKTEEKQFKDPHDTLGNKLPGITCEVGMLPTFILNCCQN